MCVPPNAPGPSRRLLVQRGAIAPVRRVLFTESNSQRTGRQLNFFRLEVNSMQKREGRKVLEVTKPVEDPQSAHARWLFLGYGLLLFLWAAAASQAQDAAPALNAKTGVAASPDTVIIDDKQKAVQINLTYNGEPIPARDILGYELYVEKNTYAEFLSFSKSDGVVTIKPTESLQIGTYDLVITTRRGPARVSVAAPLKDMPSSLENRAAAQGVTVDELKEAMGVGPQVVRSNVQLSIPPQHYVGQVINLQMPADRGVQHVWKVNGNIIAHPTPGQLSYTFPSPGTYVFEMTELSPSGQVLSTGTATTEVIATQAQETTITPNTRLTLHGPDGYSSYAWTMDGQPAGNEKSFQNMFRKVGAHVVQVTATGKPGDPAAATTVTYNVNVVPGKSRN
jgi:hypothetical protein